LDFEFGEVIAPSVLNLPLSSKMMETLPKDSTISFIQDRSDFDAAYLYVFNSSWERQTRTWGTRPGKRASSVYEQPDAMPEAFRRIRVLG
jgi:hypothetical protein